MSAAASKNDLSSSSSTDQSDVEGREEKRRKGKRRRRNVDKEPPNTLQEFAERLVEDFQEFRRRRLDFMPTMECKGALSAPLVMCAGYRFRW